MPTTLTKALRTADAAWQLNARRRYVALAAVTVALGLTVHLGGSRLATAWRDVAGDALWAAMIYWFAGAVAPTARIAIRAGATLAVCFAVEVSQLYHVASIDALRATTLGHLVLGSGFDARDFLAYTAGVLAAGLLDRSRVGRLVWVVPGERWASVLAGFASGLLGALLFAAAHALLILPIWSRMASGLAFGALAGAAAGWALAENYPAFVAAPQREVAAVGIRFGIVLWLLVAPVTAADAVLRAIGIATRFELVAVGVALTLAVSGGAAFGWWRTRRRRAMLAMALATLSLTLAMAGPVPVARSARALGIFFSVLPVAALSGAALALFARLLFLRGDEGTMNQFS